MTTLTIYPDDLGDAGEQMTEYAEIAAALNEIGVELEHWQANRRLDDNAGQEEILAAYEDSISKLNERYGFQSIDVVSMTPDHPDRDTMRSKFLAEHTHADFEVRFFVDGKGLFYLHVNNRVYAVLCEKGDLLSVPADTTHWFDMGSAPEFKCIRFFTTADGWVGNFTGSEIAKQFPDYDQYLSSLS